MFLLLDEPTDQYILLSETWILLPEMSRMCLNFYWFLPITNTCFIFVIIVPMPDKLSAEDHSFLNIL